MSDVTAKVVTKEDLLKVRFGIEDFHLDGVGTVKIRSVSRELVMSLNSQDPPVTPIDRERQIVSAALVEPKLSVEDVTAWQASSPAGEIEPLTRAIMKLSGLGKDAAKAAVKSPGS